MSFSACSIVSRSTNFCCSAGERAFAAATSAGVISVRALIASMLRNMHAPVPKLKNNFHKSRKRLLPQRLKVFGNR